MSIAQTKVIDWPYSDHRIVLSQCTFKSNKPGAKVVSLRKLDKLTIEKLVSDFNSFYKVCLDNSDGNVNERVSQFSEIILNLINNHAPEKRRNLRTKDNVPWYDCDLHRKQKIVSKSYRVYLKDMTTANKQEYSRNLHEYKHLMKEKRIAFFAKKAN